MPIKSIEIMNVMGFRRQRGKAGFELQFCDGINVLIGENGVGKTTILKMIYAAAQHSAAYVEQGREKKFQYFFSNSRKDCEALKSAGSEEDNCYYKVSDGTHGFTDSLFGQDMFHLDGWRGLNIQSVFIPTTEMLSHAKGFLAMNQKYNMPFDDTQVDIIVNASLPETREISGIMQGILEKISNAIDGTVILEDDSFYVLKRDGEKIDFSLEAEGMRKLGLLWKLIRNCLLEGGSILLWDEPEANLNPELYPLVAEILLELQKNGVQIFAATHNYNFAKYLEIRRTEARQVMFHNLYRDNNIYAQSACRMEDIKQNHMMMADNKLLDEVYGM